MCCNSQTEPAADSREAIKWGFNEQRTQASIKLSRAFEATSSSLEDVIKVSIILTDMRSSWFYRAWGTFESEMPYKSDSSRKEDRMSAQSSMMHWCERKTCGENHYVEHALSQQVNSMHSRGADWPVCSHARLRRLLQNIPLSKAESRSPDLCDRLASDAA